MKTLILGSAGQLGEELARQLPDAVAFDRDRLDVTNFAAIREVVASEMPAIVFNATSFNRVDSAESDPVAAFTVNTHAVRELAKACRAVRCRLVHFSTNYVFGQDETRRSPYRETEQIAPINAYGVSKALGENFVQAICPDGLVIRTAALFGRSLQSRHNFLDNMLARAKAGDTVRIVNDQTIAPTTTRDLASAAIQMAIAGVSGLVHLNGPSSATWYELARDYLTLAGFGHRIEPATTTEIGAPARRPRYSVLDIGKYGSMGFPPPMAWQEAVRWYWSLRH